MNKTIAIIPARGGSQRVLNKNMKAFDGKPIIVHSIEKAKESGLFDAIYVATDSASIAEIALAAGATVIWRALDDGTMGTQEVTARALMEIPHSIRDMVCCIYATAPLMSVDDLVKGSQLTGPNGFTLSVGTDPLRDAGQFYWGLAKHFINNEPLLSTYTRMVPIDEKRVCDINTYDDWYEAVKKYEALQYEMEAEHVG